MNETFKKVAPYVVIGVLAIGVVASLFIEKPEDSYVDRPQVKYLFSEDGVPKPYDTPPMIEGPLWAKVSGSKVQPSPKVNGFTTMVSRKAFMEATGYEGYCELPKIVRNETNSDFCLVCHEQHNVGNSSLRPISYNSSHPMKVRYQCKSECKPAPEGNLKLVFEEIHCTTCHDYWATPRQEKWVAVDPRILCTSCHIK